MSIESRQASQADLDTIENQLGRTPRDVHAISYRCPCGKPAVVETPPRLSDGEPFPTHFYLTCANLNSMIGTLEASGLMKEYEERLSTDKEFAEQYKKAHIDYLDRRNKHGLVDEITENNVNEKKNVYELSINFICRSKLNSFFTDLTLSIAISHK